MSMILFAAAAAAAATAPPAAVLSNDPDVRCMAAFLVAAGDAEADASVPATDKAGIQSIVMYYFGKLDVKRPGADLRSEIMTMVAAPAYTALLRGDIERCGAEAQVRGDYLSTFGGEKTETPAAKP